MSTTTASGGASPWFNVINQFGLGMADRLSESVQAFADAKLDQELSRHTMYQSELDRSKNQEAQAAAAPDKGKDSDGATITESDVITLAGVDVERSTLQKVGIGLGVAGIAMLGYKALK